MSTANLRLPRILTKGELERLLETARAPGTRDIMLVALVLDTGLRVGEVASLRASSIGVDRLLVEGKAGRRRTPVSEPVARGLEALEQGGDVIWRGSNGQPMKVNSLRRAYARLFDRAGIQGRGPAALTLRHTFAARYIEAGGSVVDVQFIMGYAQATATLRFLDVPHHHIWGKHRDLSPLLSLDFAPEWC